MSSPASSSAKLRRALGLWDLILYGVIVIQPTAPMSVLAAQPQATQALLGR